MNIPKDMLQSLVPIEMKEKEGFDAILYGEPKSGKTTTLGQAGMKVLLLDLEGGSSVIADSPNVERVSITKLEQLDAYSSLLETNQYVTKEGKLAPLEHLVAIDSITRLQDLVKEYIVKTLAPNRRREITGRFGAQADWGDFGQIIKDLVKGFHYLTKRGDKSIHVMWIAHRDDKKDDINGSVTSTQIKMQGSAVSEVMSIVDALFYMEKIVGKDGAIHYCIRTAKMGVVDAGVRQTLSEERLPKVIENPVWKDVFNQLGYKTN